MDRLWRTCGKDVRQKLFCALATGSEPLSSGISSVSSLVSSEGFHKIPVLGSRYENVIGVNTMNAALPHAVAPTILESWFDLLDQRRFVVENQRLTARVSGVHIVGVDTWIQLDFEEDDRRSLLVHLTPGTGVGAAVEAIHDSLLRRQPEAYTSRFATSRRQ